METIYALMALFEGNPLVKIFYTISSAMLKNAIWIGENLIKICKKPRHTVITVPADGLASLGAEASASTMMNTFVFTFAFMILALTGLLIF